MSMNKKVYAVLVDLATGKVGIKLIDSTLHPSVSDLEGKISLFGGTINNDEISEDALVRELEEEIPGFVAAHDVIRARLVIETDRPSATLHVYAVPTDLSGHRHTRDSDRIGQLAKACREGDGVVRTFGFILNSDELLFLDPLFKTAIINAYDVLRSSV